MAGVRDSQLVKRGPWPRGIDNQSAENAMPTNEFGTRPVAVREADNIDFDRAGWPRRRRGQDHVFAGVRTHSVWSESPLPFGLLVDDGRLCAVDASETVTPLDVVVGAQPLSYALINDRVFYGSRTHSGLVTLDLQHWDWAPEQPAGQPDVTAAAGGSLAPGQYQVAVTFTDALGRESGTGVATAVDVPANGTILLAHVPQPQNLAVVTTTNVYCTDANDVVLRLAFSTPSGAASDAISQPAQGRMLTTQFLQPLPSGQIVRYGGGRQYVATGPEVLWSEPMRYGHYNPARNRVRFANTVDMMEPVGDGGPGAGVYVGTGTRTYFMAGADPKDFTQAFVMPCGVVPGAARVPGTSLGLDIAASVPTWLARNGKFCVGLPGGTIEVLKKDDAVIDDADRAALLFRQQDGVQQLVAALRAPRRQGLAVVDRAQAHVIPPER